MASAHLPNNFFLRQGIPTQMDAFVLVIKTQWNAPIVDSLENSCLTIFSQHGVNFKTITVPGAVEIPFMIQQYAKKNPTGIDAFIALGVVIKGETPHFEIVCNAINNSITQLNLQLDMPVIMGVLTVLNEQQAIDRTANGKAGDKGEEAAYTALQMIQLQRNFII